MNGHMNDIRPDGRGGSPRRASSATPVSSLREVLHDARRLAELVRLACPLIRLNDRRAHAASGDSSSVAATTHAKAAAKPPTTCATRPAELIRLTGLLARPKPIGLLTKGARRACVISRRGARRGAYQAQTSPPETRTSLHQPSRAACACAWDWAWAGACACALANAWACACSAAAHRRRSSGHGSPVQGRWKKHTHVGVHVRAVCVRARGCEGAKPEGKGGALANGTKALRRERQAKQNGRGSRAGSGSGSGDVCSASVARRVRAGWLAAARGYSAHGRPERAHRCVPTACAWHRATCTCDISWPSYAAAERRRLRGLQALRR
jgi:hypothetical protein